MIKDFNKSFGINKDDKVSIGIGGWIADVRINESIELTSDVPDNYVEDGSVIHDHIINNPIVLNIEGEVSEVNIKSKFIDETSIKYIDKTQNILNNVFPARLTNQATQKIKSLIINANDYYSQLEHYAKSVQNLYNIFKNDSKTISLQKEFIDFLNRIYYSKELITIETPFGIYKNMRIVSISLTRENIAYQAIKYKITAKEVRFAETIFVDKNKYFKNPSESTKGKVKSQSDKGSVQGKKVHQSLLYTLFHKG